MCYLQETTFNCGCSHKSLFMACKYVELIACTTDSEAHWFCLQGSQVVKSSIVDESCGSAHWAGCVLNTIFKPLIDRKTMVKNELDSYAKRIFSVKICLESGNLPLYNFYQVAREGWDAKEQQGRMDDFWNKILPAEVESMVSLLSNNRHEIIDAFTLMMNECLQKLHGVDSNAFNEEMLLTAPGCTWFDEVVHAATFKIQGELLKMEVHAVEACMDDIGWTFPDDKSAKESLAHCMSKRLVQPVEQSGTAVREAFVREGLSHHEDDDDVMLWWSWLFD